MGRRRKNNKFISVDLLIRHTITQNKASKRFFQELHQFLFPTGIRYVNQSHFIDQSEKT